MNAARSGRPRKLTEADIAEAVLAEGFAGLTVPAVAQRLGVSTMTLYRYTPTRAELLALAWNHVIDRAAWPEAAGSWRKILHQHAVALWDLLAAHPGAVSELSGAVVPPRMMGLYDDLALTLTAQGFTASEAVLAVDTTIDLAVDHRRGVEDLTRREHEADGDAREQLEALWKPRTDDPTDRAAVRAAMHEAITTHPRDWFAQKLDLMLDGLTTRRITTADQRRYPCE